MSDTPAHVVAQIGQVNEAIAEAEFRPTIPSEDIRDHVVLEVTEDLVAICRPLGGPYHGAGSRRKVQLEFGGRNWNRILRQLNL